jgi:agmatinase
MPVPWQATTSYRRGTREGPSATIAASAQVDLHDLDTGDAWRAGFAVLPEDPRIRALDLRAEPDALEVIGSAGGAPAAAARVNALSEALNELVHARIARLLAEGRIPGVLGGDHSAPFGAIQAVAERFPGVGILHVDAHADLREAYEGFTWSHASIFHNVVTRLPGVGRLTQVGLRDVGEAEIAFRDAHPGRITWFTDPDLARASFSGTPWLAQVHGVVATLPPEVYVSFDIDGLDPAFCPNTGTPVPGGLGFREAALLLAEVAAARRIVGFDLNEVGDGEWDGNVAARLLLKLCGHAVRSQLR